MLPRILQPTLSRQPCRLLSTLSRELFSTAVPPPSSKEEGTATFGYEEVAASEKAGRVGEVFSSVAPSYDLMNDLMSAGMHRLWKDRLVTLLRPFPGIQHLDMAGGTGDVAFKLLRAAQLAEQAAHSTAEAASATEPEGPGAEACVTVCDINAAMLSEGQKRAARVGLDRGLRWVLGDAEKLPMPSQGFDSYSIAFGIRNVTHIDRALEEAYRVLKPGGLFACLEFSEVAVPGLRELYDAYSFNVIPQIGRVMANDEASYRYLVESIRRFPSQERFAGMVRRAGFSGVKYENLLGGIVAIHTGFKLP